MLRVFVAIEIPSSITEALEGTRGGVEGARWQRDDQLHLTLAFIGEVPNKQLTEIADELSRIHFKPFDLQLQGVDYFGKKPTKPNSLWAGVVDKEPLVHLHEKITHALMNIGLEMDTRKFKPHVTLARFKRGATARLGDWLSVNEALKTPTETIGHFSLFSSQLTSERAFYQVEARFGEALSWEDAEDGLVFGGAS